ncbi:MAG: hypothetical protein J1F11_10175 [Oscillospiraceae bacterium]|nr:hypothetical protein [Oscillospiraceae bacterium]
MLHEVNFKIRDTDGIFRHCHSLDVICHDTEKGYFYTVKGDCFGFDDNGEEYRIPVSIYTDEYHIFKSPDTAFTFVKLICEIYPLFVPDVPDDLLGDYDERNFDINYAAEFSKSYIDNL